MNDSKYERSNFSEENARSRTFVLFLSWLPGHGGKQQENSYLEPSHHVLAATSGTAEKFGTLLSVVRNWTPIHWQSCRAPKTHLGKVLHCPPGEGARKEFSCCFSPCPGSHVRNSTKVLLPAFCGEKTDLFSLAIMHRKKKKITSEHSAAPLKKMLGRNSLAASHPALAAM